MTFDLNTLLRPNIRTLKKYSSARDEFSGRAAIFLDANENTAGSAGKTVANRYPDPLQKRLRRMIAAEKGIDAEDKIFLGNGSDEAIDILVRAFCEPGRDRLMLMPPTYGMYRVCADINDAAVLEVPLKPDFSMDTDAVIREAERRRPKLIFICTPNNPSGNSFPPEDIEAVLRNTGSVVLVDEAYIDFSERRSWTRRLDEFPNLVVLQTFSKAWGMAGVRLGIAFASPEITAVMNKIKYPYNVSDLTATAVIDALGSASRKRELVRSIIRRRAGLMREMRSLPMVEHIFPTDANFFLARFRDAKAVYGYLRDRGIVVRDRSGQLHCDNCLRITVGTPEENRVLTETLKNYAAEERS